MRPGIRSNRPTLWGVAPALALLWALAGCADGPLVPPPPPDEAPAETVQALGVPQDGFPSWKERMVLMLTNRARADPAAEVAETCSGSCASYSPSKPLYHNHKMALAARFQATSLKKAGSGLQHESVCKLVSNIGSIYPNQCDGDPSCACEGGTASCSCSGGKPYCTCPGGACTQTFSRISMFGVSSTGENAAAGNTDPKRTFSQWVRSSGHWSNINKNSHGALGVGEYSGGGGGCWSAFWVQVFGYGSNTPKIPSGAHYPEATGPGGQVTFYASYYDPGSKPTVATVNVGGTCHTMQVERGSDDNGSYIKDVAMSSSGCVRYYFFFRDASGQVVTYPSAGSYGVAVGGGPCDDYSASSRPSLGQGCGGCTTAKDCDDANPCTTDTCSAQKCKNTAVAGCCTTAAQCDDKNPCTTDTCSAQKCKNTPKSGCCQKNGDCDDKNPCTTDTCKGNSCDFAPIPDCCQKAADCDDKDPCTTDACSGGTCKRTPISGCCKQDSQCNDGSDCTRDTCDTAKNRCTFAPISGCCQKDTDCADKNPCTTETCQLPAGTCKLLQTPGCCQKDTDCADGDPCTKDTCDTAQNRCKYSAIAGCASPGGDAGGSSGDGGVLNLGPSSTTLAGGCAVGGASAPGSAAWLLLLLLGLALRRRR